jgi:hypothetical protein
MPAASCKAAAASAEESDMKFSIFMENSVSQSEYQPQESSPTTANVFCFFFQKRRFFLSERNFCAWPLRSFQLQRRA